MEGKKIYSRWKPCCLEEIQTRDLSHLKQSQWKGDCQEVVLKEGEWGEKTYTGTYYKLQSRLNAGSKRSNVNFISKSCHCHVTYSPRLWVFYSFINGVWKGGKSAQNYTAETAKIFRKDSFITSKTFVTFKIFGWIISQTALMQHKVERDFFVSGQKF